MDCQYHVAAGNPNATAEQKCNIRYSFRCLGVHDGPSGSAFPVISIWDRGEHRIVYNWIAAGDHNLHFQIDIPRLPDGHIIHAGRETRDLIHATLVGSARIHKTGIIIRQLNLRTGQSWLISCIRLIYPAS